MLALVMRIASGHFVPSLFPREERAVEGGEAGWERERMEIILNHRNKRTKNTGSPPPSENHVRGLPERLVKT